jgi:Ca2+-binding RTX toxin-like protein
VRTNDIDPDQDGIMTITSPVAHGSLSINLVTGAFTYTPAIDYVGNDSFTYRLYDGEFESFGVVSVVVSPAVVQAGVLYIAGTIGSDRIIVQPASGNISFRFNNLLFGPYTVATQVVVFGLGGNDNITVSGNVAVPVAFYGGEGNDYLAGGNLNDVLDGGNGVDRLLGGNGDDTLYGGADNDTLSGANGNDLLDGDSYTDIPTVITGGNMASLIGAVLLPPLALHGKDTIGGDAGNDTLLGRGGDDTLNGGNDNDSMDGDVGNDKMDGGSGDDLMLGGAGGDTLYGRAGADVLIGGTEVDTLYGAAGADLIFGDSVTNPGLLAAIALNWAATDYAGASAALKAIAVNDNAVDTLHGEGDADWYLMYTNDKLKLATESKAPNVIIPLP